MLIAPRGNESSGWPTAMCRPGGSPVWPWLGGEAMLTFEGSKDVEIKGKRIADDVPGRTKAIVKMKRYDATVARGQDILGPATEYEKP